MAWRWVAAAVVAAGIAMWPFLGRQTSAPGEMAPFDFTLAEMNGHQVKLSDYKGKPLLINFWATWCGPCRAELPLFVEFTEKYGQQGFMVLGISVDDTAEQLKPFAAQNRLNYPMLMALGNEKVLDAYSATIYPTSWLVRRDGTVKVKQVGAATEQWFRTQVKELVDGQ